MVGTICCQWKLFRWELSAVGTFNREPIYNRNYHHRVHQQWELFLQWGLDYLQGLLINGEDYLLGVIFSGNCLQGAFCSGNYLQGNHLQWEALTGGLSLVKLFIAGLSSVGTIQSDFYDVFKKLINHVSFVRSMRRHLSFFLMPLEW